MSACCFVSASVIWVEGEERDFSDSGVRHQTGEGWRRGCYGGCFDRKQRKEVSALLALTDSAVQAVKGIVSSSEEAPETGGLRVVAERAGAQASFQLSVVRLPAEDDEVIEEQGARVFLDPEAASLLEDKVLDASVEQNQVAFTLADQLER